MTDVLKDYYLNRLDTGLGGKGMTQTEAETYEKNINPKTNKPWFDINNETDRKNMLDALEYGRQFNKKWYLQYGPAIAGLLGLPEVAVAIGTVGTVVEGSYKIGDVVKGVHKKEYEPEEIIKGIISIQKEKENIGNAVKWLDTP
jgi:hypothetical protein